MTATVVMRVLIGWPIFREIGQPIRAPVAEAVKLIDDENMAAFIQKEYLNWHTPGNGYTTT